MVQLRSEPVPGVESAREPRNAVRREMLAKLNHEVRTPITSILGLAELLIEDGDLRHVALTRAAAVSRMKANGARLLGFIDRLLELSDLESGTDTAAYTRVSPVELAEELRASVGSLAKHKLLAFRVACGPGLPASFETDPSALQRILGHLLENAIRFTAEGEVSLSIDFAASIEVPHLIFEVRDSGQGMSPERLDALFEPLGCDDSEDPRSYGGTGVGLAIVDELVRRLGGRMEVESELDAGSRFRVLIPAGTPRA